FWCLYFAAVRVFFAFVFEEHSVLAGSVFCRLVPQQVDEYELVDPVDILTPLEKSGFWDGVKAAKWSERKEAVAELTKLASTKRIAPGDFTEVCRMLKKLITDVNIAVAVEAIQAIGNLARGLRTHFSGNSCFLLPVLLLYNELYRPHLLFPMLGAVLDQ
ncbi:Protein MICROTUBULE ORGANIZATION 1, partial [Ancistrocladus abbreviatus]